MWRWADADNSGTIDVLDINRAADAFSGRYYSTTPCITDSDCLNEPPNYQCDVNAALCYRLILENTDLRAPDSCDPDFSMSVLDLVAYLDTFRGLPNPCAGQCAP